MPEVTDKCTFELTADQIEFRTQTNGDFVYLKGLRLTQEQATSLTWLINSGEETVLKIRIKVKE